MNPTSEVCHSPLHCPMPLKPICSSCSGPPCRIAVKRCWQLTFHDRYARQAVSELRGDILSIPSDCAADRVPARAAARRFDFRGVRHFSEVCCGSVRGAVFTKAVVHVRALVTPRALHAHHPGCWGGDGDGAGLRSTTCARCERCAFARFSLRCCLLTGARRAVLAASRGRHDGELAAWGHACALAWAWRRALRRGAVEGKSMRATGGRRFRDLFHVASVHVSACIYMNDQNF